MVTINGKDFDIDGRTISDYLFTKDYGGKRITVEKNGDIIPKKDYNKIVLHDGDKLEIISFAE